MAKICPKCGETSNSERLFCGQCGEKMVKRPEMPKCKNCGEFIWPHEKFCTGCGLNRETALNGSKVIVEQEAAAESTVKEKLHKPWWRFWPFGL